MGPLIGGARSGAAWVCGARRHTTKAKTFKEALGRCLAYRERSPTLILALAGEGDLAGSEPSCCQDDGGRAMRKTCSIGALLGAGRRSMCRLDWSLSSNGGSQECCRWRGRKDPGRKTTRPSETDEGSCQPHAPAVMSSSFSPLPRREPAKTHPRGLLPSEKGDI